MVEYTYASGTKLLSQCRQQSGCWNGVGEHVHGTNGSADISNAKIFDAKGNLVWHSAASEHKGNGWQQHQHDLVAALRRGENLNEVEYAAESTLTAIMGRMATYSGKIVKWERAISDPTSLADSDRLVRLDDPAPTQPDQCGRYPIPVSVG